MILLNPLRQLFATDDEKLPLQMPTGLHWHNSFGCKTAEPITSDESRIFAAYADHSS